MALNKTSFLAGVGSVVAVLSTGLAGGYFLAGNSSHIDPPNRLQRVAAANQDSKPAPVATDARPEVVATSAPIAAPAPEQAAPTAAAIQEAAVPAPAAKPDTDAKSAEARNNDAKTADTKTADTMTTNAKVHSEKANLDKARAADARAGEKKRTETRKIAEQQRKQRELDVATIAVRRIIHERDAPDVVVDSDQTEQPAAEMPHFNLFRQ